MKIKVIVFLAAISVVCCQKVGSADVRNNQLQELREKGAINVVKGFLVWYRENYPKLNQFKTIRGGLEDSPDENKPEKYYVDFTEAEKYIAYLRHSGFLSEKLLQRERRRFDDGEKNFKAAPYDDAPPAGFDYDHFFMTQEAFEEDLEKIDGIKFDVVTVNAEKATVKFYLPLPGIHYSYGLINTKSGWLIDDVGQD